MKIIEKFIFEPSDFEGCGQMIIRNSSPKGSKDYSYASTVCYKIGYKAGGNDLFMFAMNDGLVMKIFEDEKELCDYLNADPVGYRPMTRQDVINIISVEGGRFPQID